MSVTKHELQFSKLCYYAYEVIESEEDKIAKFLKGSKESLFYASQAFQFTNYKLAVSFALKEEVDELTKAQDKLKGLCEEVTPGESAEASQVWKYCKQENTGKGAKRDFCCFTCNMVGHKYKDCPYTQYSYVQYPMYTDPKQAIWGWTP